MVPPGVNRAELQKSWLDDASPTTLVGPSAQIKLFLPTKKPKTRAKRHEPSAKTSIKSKLFNPVSRYFRRNESVADPTLLVIEIVCRLPFNVIVTLPSVLCCLL